jgi:hypothetical protein
MNKFKRKHVFSVIFTLFIVFLLVFSGPASAVTINVATDKETYDASDSSVTFTVQVDIESNERIPVQNLTLRITGPFPFSKNCIFTPTGTKLTSCSNLEITVINSTAISSSYGNGSMFGSGYGYNFTSGQNGTENQTFGENYGYGYISGHEHNSSSYAELAYNITWNISAESTPLTGGTYDANLEALAQSGSYARIYSAQTPIYFGYTRPPTYSLNSTNTTMAGKPTEFRLKWNDDVGLSGYVFSLSNCTDSFTNSTWIPITGATNWSNMTYIINSTIGCTIRWIVYANNTNNKWNTSQIYSFTTTDGNPPTWSNPQNSTPTIYSSSTLSEFNITWQDNVAVSKVLIEINTTVTAYNYTMTNTYGGNIYNYSIILPAGTFTWKSYANDTGNNWNSSSSWSVTIGKTAPTIHLALNQSESNKTYTYPEAVNVTGWVEVPSGETGSLYKNNTLISGFNSSDDFTSYDSSKWLNDTTQGDFFVGSSPSSSVAWKINDSNLVGYNLGSGDGRGQNFWYKTKLNLPLNVSWYAKVPSLVNWEVFAVCLVDTNDTAYRAVRNQTCFAYIDDNWGIYTINKEIGSWNYSGTTDATFSVFKKHELRWNGTWLEAYRDNNLLWNGSLGDFPTTDMYLVFLISHNNAHSTDTYFYIDNITIRTTGETKEIRTLTPTHYNYTFVYNGNENYSSSSATYYAFVNKAPTSVNLYINGSTSNHISSYPNSTLNATAVSNVSGLYVQLWRNGTLIADSATAVTDITKWGAWNNNFTVQVLGNENYLSSDSVTLWWNVSRGNASLVLSNNLSWSGTYPASSNTTGSGCPSEVTCNFYRNDTLVSSPNNVLLDVGSYNYVYNTSGNENYSSNSTSNTLTINASSRTVNINFSEPSPITYETLLQVGCIASAGSDDGSLKLFRNGTDVTSTEKDNLIRLSVGTWQYVCNITQGVNYTSATATQNFVISQKNANVGISPTTQTIIYGNSLSQLCTDNSTLLECNLFRDGVLITNSTSAILSAGTHNYVANISDNVNYTNYQNTSVITVNKASSACNLLITPTTPIIYETQHTPVCSCNNSEVTPTLWRNDINVSTQNNTALILGMNTYNYTCNVSSTTNYSSASNSSNYVINQKNASVKVYPITQTITYPQSVTEYCTDTSSTVHCQIYRNGTLIANGTTEVLGVGVYNYLVNISDNQNYTDWNSTSTLTINKASSPLILTNNISWNGTYPASSNTTGFGCPSGITCNLYRNNSLVSESHLALLEAGAHTYVYNTSGNENYSSNSTSNTLTINQKNASVKVYPITQTITYPQSVTEYCTVNSSLINCNIFRNGSQIVNGTNETLGAGVYSYLANISDTSNYTNTQDSSTLTINRATSTCSLSGITNHTYGSADTAICSCTGEGTIHLYQNNTLRDEWNNTARMYENATYIWVCNMTDVNYTDASTSKTQTINVTNTTTGTYTNNSVSTTANTTTTINATTSSDTIITLDAVTTSNVTNSFISVTEYNSTPSGITNLTTIGIYGLNKFFDISVGSSLNSSLRWVVINISYNESEVNASGLSESSLRIYYYNSTISNWSSYDTPFGGVNTTSNYVWANTTHFSYYSLGGLLTNGQSCNSNSNCYSGYCVHSICRSSSPYCGDGYCDSGETITNCPADCPSSTPYVGSGWVTPTIKKEENVTQEAEEKPICQEVWTCTDWSDCQNSVETRICNDVNNCGTTDKKPILSQSCVVPTSSPSISPPTPTTPLGLGVGLIAVIALSAIIIFIILKRKKIKKKTKFANMIP